MTKQTQHTRYTNSAVIILLVRDSRWCKLFHELRNVNATLGRRQAVHSSLEFSLNQVARQHNATQDAKDENAKKGEDKNKSGHLVPLVVC